MTVLKIFVEVTVPEELGPVIVSDNALPSISVPVIVKEILERSFELFIVKNELRPLEAAPD